MKAPTTSYNLSIPTDTFRTLKNMAEQENTSIADLLRRATKLLLFVRSIKTDPDASLLVKRGKDTQEIALELV